MNQKKRKTLVSSITSLQAGADGVRRALELMDDVLEDERDCYDSLPEGLQESERGLSMCDAIDHMEQASDSLHEALDLLEEAESDLNESVSS